MGRKESPIEDYLVACALDKGAAVRKVTYQGRKGAPDRWCFFPFGMLLIAECKAPGETPEPLQVEEMKLLRSHGYYVCWLDSKEQVDSAISLIGHWDRFTTEFPL